MRRRFFCTLFCFLRNRVLLRPEYFKQVDRTDSVQSSPDEHEQAIVETRIGTAAEIPVAPLDTNKSGVSHDEAALKCCEGFVHVTRARCTRFRSMARFSPSHACVRTFRNGIFAKLWTTPSICNVLLTPRNQCIHKCWMN